MTDNETRRDRYDDDIGHPQSNPSYNFSHDSLSRRYENTMAANKSNRNLQHGRRCKNGTKRDKQVKTRARHKTLTLASYFDIVAAPV